jgi:methylated-DNA-[protein]-cysteine S-methyltransferase
MNPSAEHHTLFAQTEIDTPLGPMTAVATTLGLTGLYFDAQKNRPEGLGARDDPRHPHLRAARRWLEAYWSGPAPAANGLTLDLHGTAFQRAVWKVLLGIPYGRTLSYGEVAARVGGGAVPRATGAAVGRNPVSLIVPCHRVIGADGSLTGYAAGLPRKKKLLVHEGVLLA